MVYIELLTHVATILYFTLLFYEYNSMSNQLVGMAIILLIFYRGFFLLRIFSAFTSLVGIINTVIKKLVSFFLILFYAYLMIIILMSKLSNTGTIDHIRDVYYWVFLGGIGGESFDMKYSAIPIIIGSLVITVVLLNILIAYLSNVFSRLEDQQKVTDLKEKADLILDIEMLVRFFKYKLTGVVSLENKMEKLREQAMIESKEIDLEKVNYLILFESSIMCNIY